MDRLIVRFGEEHVNIGVTRIEREESVVFAYRDNALVGVFDLGAVDMLYISPFKGGKDQCRDM